MGAQIAMSAGVDLEALRSELRQRAVAAAETGGACDDTDRFLRCTRAQRPSFGPKSVDDLVLAVFEPPFGLAPALAQHGLTLEKLRAALPEMLGNAAPVWGHALEAFQQAKMVPPPDTPPASRPPEAHPRAVEAERAPEEENKDDDVVAKLQAREEAREEELDHRQSVLSTFGVDLVEQARRGRLDPVVGREMEVTRVLQILARRTKNNVCLVGDPGVGKTAVAEAVAQRIAAGHVPSQLATVRELWSLDIGALLAGTGLRGDFEERLQVVLGALTEAQGKALLFVDELHLLLGAGRSENNNIDAANLLKPMLARGELRCIGATTGEEYRDLILAKDAAFERRFQPIELREPSTAAAVEMLNALRPLYEKHHSVGIAPTVAEAAVRLSDPAIRNRRLPDKAIDVLDEACCLAVATGYSEVSEAHVQTVVDRWRAQALQGHQAGLGPLRQLLARVLPAQWMSFRQMAVRSRL